mgnify:CR=1 FL=1
MKKLYYLALSILFINCGGEPSKEDKILEASKNRYHVNDEKIEYQSIDSLNFDSATYDGKPMTGIVFREHSNGNLQREFFYNNAIFLGLKRYYKSGVLKNEEWHHPTNNSFDRTEYDTQGKKTRFFAENAEGEVMADNKYD